MCPPLRARSILTARNLPASAHVWLQTQKQDEHIKYMFWFTTAKTTVEIFGLTTTFQMTVTFTFQIRVSLII